MTRSQVMQYAPGLLLPMKVRLRVVATPTLRLHLIERREHGVRWTTFAQGDSWATAYANLRAKTWSDRPRKPRAEGAARKH